MNAPIADQIKAEMKQVELDLEAQRKFVKKSLGNAPAIEAAELELKALHTRQDVLKGNLKKSRSDAGALDLGMAKGGRNGPCDIHPSQTLTHLTC